MVGGTNLHGVWQKVSELHEQIWVVGEELRHLLQDILDPFLLLRMINTMVGVLRRGISI